MTFPVQPIGSLLFIEPLLIESTVAVVIDPRASWRGKVLAAGPGAPLPDGATLPMECGVGDIVRLKPSNAIESVFHQTRVWIVKDEDILAIEMAPPPDSDEWGLPDGADDDASEYPDNDPGI